jgi:16S rRNA A1518/A1519 N6-dimethyltransferase RsmA/KsgA/DIM1 with predicted DNA glycosylase/AP lyase activity
LTPLKEIDLKPEFLDFVKLGFSQRRKTLTKIMKSKFPVKEMEENLENLGFSGKSRAESLDPASLLALWLKLTSV